MVGQLKTTNLHIRYALNILSHLLILSMQFYQLEIKHSRILYKVVNFKFELCLGFQDIEGTGTTGCLLRTATYREKNQLKRENYVAPRRAESLEQCLPFDIRHGDSKFAVFQLGFILDLVQYFSHFASIPLFWKGNAYPCICLIKCRLVSSQTEVTRREVEEGQKVEENSGKRKCQSTIDTQEARY